MVLNEEGLKTVLVFHLCWYRSGCEGSSLIACEGFVACFVMFLPFSLPTRAGGLSLCLTSPITCCRLARCFDQNETGELLLVPINSFINTKFSCSTL